MPKPTTIVVELKCTARKSITQTFPISNDSDRDWIFKVKFINQHTEIKVKVLGMNVK